MTKNKKWKRRNICIKKALEEMPEDTWGKVAKGVVKEVGEGILEKVWKQLQRINQSITQ